MHNSDAHAQLRSTNIGRSRAGAVRDVAVKVALPLPLSI
jgi:hypothetical protein